MEDDEQLFWNQHWQMSLAYVALPGSICRMLPRTLIRQRLFSSARRSKGRSEEFEPVVSKFISNNGRLPELDIKGIGEEGTRILGNMEKEMSKIRIGRAAPCNSPKIFIYLIYF